MNDTNALARLLAAIKQNIRNLQSGGASVAAVEEEYRLLAGQYETIKNERGNGGDFLGGLLYHHNVNNFTKNTTLWISGSDAPRLVAGYGHESLNPTVGELIALKRSEIREDRAIAFELPETGGVANRVYLSGFAAGDRCYLAAAVTSSAYFDPAKFQRLVDCLREITGLPERDPSPLERGYADTVLGEIAAIIRGNPYRSFIIDIVDFKRIRESMEHLSVSSLQELSREIIDLIAGRYGREAAVRSISLVTYIAAVPAETIPDLGKTPKPLEMLWHEIRIDGRITRFLIDNERALDLFMKRTKELF